MNKYTRWYFSIINNRKNNLFEGYTEVHHILPKSLGGSNDKDNLVTLSAREHFICHYLLTKMYPPNTPSWYKAIKAFLMMAAISDNQERYFNSRLYESQRINFSKAQSECQSGSKNSQYGKPRSDDTKKKISETLKNKPKKERPKKPTRLEAKEKTRQEAERLFHIYKNGNFASIREFAKSEHYNHSHVALTLIWKKYVPKYNAKQGIPYS